MCSSPLLRQRPLSEQAAAVAWVMLELSSRSPLQFLDAAERYAPTQTLYDSCLERTGGRAAGSGAASGCKRSGELYLHACTPPSAPEHGGAAEGSGLVAQASLERAGGQHLGSAEPALPAG